MRRRVSALGANAFQIYNETAGTDFRDRESAVALGGYGDTIALWPDSPTASRRTST